MKILTKLTSILLIAIGLFSCSLGGPKPCFEMHCASLTEMDQILAGEDVLMSNCTDDALGYSWDFGDGNTSKLNSPHHVWEEPGTYTIALEAEGEKKNKTIEKEITVSPSLYGYWSGTAMIDDNNEVPFSFNITQEGTKIKGEFIYGTGQTQGVISSSSSIEGNAVELKCSYVSIMYFQGEEFSSSMLFSFNGGTVNEALDTIEGTEFTVTSNGFFNEEYIYGTWKITKQ